MNTLNSLRDPLCLGAFATSHEGTDSTGEIGFRKAK
jgi:hypothetical protein